MDPNETLRLLRLTIKQMRVDDHPDVRKAHADEVAEYFEALDGWLSGGGFPPEAWREGPDAIAEDRQGPGMVPDLLAQAYAEPLGPPNPAGTELPD